MNTGAAVDGSHLNSPKRERAKKRESEHELDGRKNGGGDDRHRRYLGRLRHEGIGTQCAECRRCLADRHAGTAQARADDAYGVGNNALGVGNNALNVGNGAMTSAQLDNQKADLNASDVSKLKRKVAYLEWKTLPHHKKHHHHHTAAPEQPKTNNS